MNTQHKSNTISNQENASDMTTETCKAPETLISELSKLDIQSATRKISLTAKNLATSAPQTHRKEMAKLLNIGLYLQQRFEQSQQIPKQDINGALAIFLYGIWSINNHGNKIPAESFSQLISSTHEVLSIWGDFIKDYGRSPLKKRQSLYETFAMVGNWLLMIQHHLNSQSDDTALKNVKIMVREIIVRSLKIEPQSIHISQDGSLMLMPDNRPDEISS